MQLEPFRRRLESSTNYIDMHIEMCASDADHGEMNKTVTDLEQKFYTLLSDVEVRSPARAERRRRGPRGPPTA